MKKVSAFIASILIFSLLFSFNFPVNASVQLNFSDSKNPYLDVKDNKFTIGAGANKAFYLNEFTAEKEKSYEIEFDFMTPLESDMEYGDSERWFQHVYIAIRHGKGIEASREDSKDGHYIRLELNGRQTTYGIRAWFGTEIMVPNPGYIQYEDFELKPNKNYKFKVISKPQSFDFYIDGKYITSVWGLPKVDEGMIGFGFANPNGKLLPQQQTYTVSDLKVSEVENMVNVNAGEFKHIYNPSVGENEDWYINDHSIIKDKDGKWHMFGITHAKPANPLDEKNFAHAIGSSLTEGMWEKQPYAMTADLSNHNEYHLWAPHVIFHDDLYYMYYCAGGPTNHEYQINLATSPDLKTWTRHDSNPLIIDGFDARDPMILKNGDEWIMYYTANSNKLGGQHVVKALTSKDLLKWENERTVYTDALSGTFGGPTESPFVVYEKGWYFLFIGPYPGYVGTRVFMSDNPFSLYVENIVGHIDSHAAEVIKDSDGKYYITHCGWEADGVYISPLNFDNLIERKEDDTKPTTETTKADNNTTTTTKAAPKPDTGESQTKNIWLTFVALITAAVTMFFWRFRKRTAK